MKKGILFLIRGYQILSMGMMPRCRFVPSCSEYTYQAVAYHGAWYGLWLSLKRLLRCHPLCQGGFDPAPEAGVVMKNGQYLSSVPPSPEETILVSPFRPKAESIPLPRGSLN